MSTTGYEKYNTGRAELIKQYRKRSVAEVGITLLCGLCAIIITILLRGIIGIAVTLVLCAMILMFSIIFARVRAVTVDHTLQSRLRLYEQEEPEFHANFRK